MTEGLSGSERVRSERRIAALFDGGKWGAVGQVKYCWRSCTEPDMPPGVAIMVSAPKKSFKRAWKRNLIKRRVKESYRHRKSELLEKAIATGSHIDIVFVCAGGGMPLEKPSSLQKPSSPEKSSSLPKPSSPEKISKKTSRRAPVQAEIPDFKTIDDAIAKILSQIVARS